MKNVSILIAHYNNGRFFKDCYDSLLGQTYDNWEAIIVDDASTDDSVKIIRELIDDDPRFVLYQNTENKGCGYTKRKCVEYAKGDFCAFLDPDDALFPDAIEASVNALNSDRYIVATYSRLVFCDMNLNPQGFFKKIKQVNNNNLFFNYPIQLSHFFVFRRKIYEMTTGINPKLKTAVDQDLYLKILDYGNPKFIKKDLYKYRLHETGISQNGKKWQAKNDFAKVILDTISRRGIKQINYQTINAEHYDAEKIFRLIDYQNHPFNRLKTKVILLLKDIIDNLQRT